MRFWGYKGNPIYPQTLQVGYDYGLQKPNNFIYL